MISLMAHTRVVSSPVISVIANGVETGLFLRYHRSMNHGPIASPEVILNAARQVLQQEGEAVLAVSRRLDQRVNRAVEIVLNAPGRVIVSGMGKSGHVGRKIAATLASTGTPAFFLHPSEALHGDLGMVTEQDVLLLLSNSGETEEVVRLIPFLRRIGARILAITGQLESTLAKAADVVFDGGVEREACPLNLAPTSSTTVALALGDALAVALLEARGFRERDFARLHPSGSLGRKFLTVRDLMHVGDQMPMAGRGIPLREAIITMSRKSFGALLIADDRHRLLGIFTDGDLRRYFERSDGSLHVPLEKIMIRHPKHIGPDRLAAEALKIMESKSITALPVVEGEVLVGFLHLHDILRARLV